jgi:hypothetical protein
MILHARVREALFVLMVALVAPGRAAQEQAAANAPAPPPAPADKTSPGPASAARPPAPGARPKLSAKLAGQISSALPVWNPPLAKPAGKPPPFDPEVVEMKPFYVRETRIRLTEADVLTDTAKLKMAEARYLSPLYRVTFGPLSQVAAYYFNFLTILHGWHPNEAEAVTLYRQDERLKMLGELDSLVRLEKIADAKESKELQRIRYEAAALSR